MLRAPSRVNNFIGRKKQMTLQNFVTYVNTHKTSDRLFNVMFYIRLKHKFMIPQDTF